MSATDIQKLAVYDSRIVQSRPMQAVEQGALSITKAPFKAISANTSQSTFNISVPSENVFMDRGVQWSAECTLQMTVQVTNPALQVGEPVWQPGRHGALAAFPNHQLCSTMSATINDTTTTINSGDVLNEILRLTDFYKNREQRTCPTALDVFAQNADANLAIRNASGASESGVAPGYVPNGAFPDFFEVTAGGAPTTTLIDAATTTQTLYFKQISTENLVLSPFTFSDVKDWSTGLFGIQNIQVVMNHRSPQVARVVRDQNVDGRAISAIAFKDDGWTNSQLNVQFLTPSLNIPLPPKSIVPYMEYPRYITTGQSAVTAGATASIQSQTITLPQIPDLLVVFVKHSGTYALSEGDNYFGIERINVNFDNFSGLLNSHNQQELYAMSVHNGLEMDYGQWKGEGRSSVLGSENKQLTGSILVLKPGVDLSLQTGQAPSLVGNYTLQFDLTVKNNAAVTLTPEITLITVNSGFFESMSGSSRIIKGVLSEADIINAPMAGADREDLRRQVGGGAMSSLANAITKGKKLFDKAKEVHSAAKKVSGAVKGTARSVGGRRGKKLADTLDRVGLGMENRLA